MRISHTVVLAIAVLLSLVSVEVSADAPWQTVRPTLAPAEQPALLAMNLPVEPQTLQAQVAGTVHSLNLGTPIPNTRSNDISLEGNVSTQILGSTLNIKADTVANHRSGGTSGSLRLTIWATTYAPSYGSAINGYRLGYYQFSTTLPAGYYFGLPGNPPIDRTVTYAGNPPNGTYYITMTADEYSSSNNSSVNDGYGYHDLIVLRDTWSWGATVSPCSFSLSSYGATAGAGGGNGSVTVTSGPSGCTGSWSATSNVSWITIVSGSSGSGSGSATVGFSVAATSGARTGTMTIAGHSFLVTQSGPSVSSCSSYSVSPLSVSAAVGGGSGSITVSGSPSGCSGNWSAYSNASWISITYGGSGSGSGSVGYSVGANATSLSRSGTMNIAGQTVTLSQASGSSSGNCSPDFKTACVLNGRFRVSIRYRGAFDNNAADSDAVVKKVTGFGSANYETAFFYFNSENNVELLLKMLDQGNTDGAGRPTIAVLFGSATPLRVEVTITDTAGGAVKRYISPFNTMQGATDFTAFIK